MDRLPGHNAEWCKKVSIFRNKNMFSQNYQCECGGLKFPQARISNLYIMIALCYALPAEYGSEFSCAAYGRTWFPSTSLFMRPRSLFCTVHLLQEDSPMMYKVLVHERRRSNMLTEHAVNVWPLHEHTSSDPSQQLIRGN